jgi:hypothetical protein
MKSRSLIGVILGVLMVAMVVTGCGKKESIQKKGDDEGPWFETEFHDFKLSEDEFVPTICMYENEMYFVIYRKDTNTENRLMTLKKMSLDNYTVSDVKTVIEQALCPIENTEKKADIIPNLTVSDLSSGRISQ